MILSQQNLPSDDEDDDEPHTGDLRNHLKRKFEPIGVNDPATTDLRLMLDAAKSRRVMTSNSVPDEPDAYPPANLRAILNTKACDLRVQLSRSKPTDLRRQLEKSKASSGSLQSHGN